MYLLPARFGVQVDAVGEFPLVPGHEDSAAFPGDGERKRSNMSERAVPVEQPHRHPVLTGGEHEGEVFRDEDDQIIAEDASDGDIGTVEKDLGGPACDRRIGPKQGNGDNDVCGIKNAETVRAEEHHLHILRLFIDDRHTHGPFGRCGKRIRRLSERVCLQRSIVQSKNNIVFEEGRKHNAGRQRGARGIPGQIHVRLAVLGLAERTVEEKDMVDPLHLL